MNFCHGLDIVHYLTGLEVRSVSASVMNVGRVGDIEDTVVVNARFGNGALGVLAGSAAARGLRHETLRILGSDGRLELRPAGIVYTNRNLGGLGIVPNEPTNLGSPAGPDVARSRYFGAFADAAREGRRPDVTFDDGIFVQAVIEAAYEAAMTSGPVDPADLIRRAKGSITEASPIEGPPAFVEDWRDVEEMMADHAATVSKKRSPSAKLAGSSPWAASSELRRRISSIVDDRFDEELVKRVVDLLRDHPSGAVEIARSPKVAQRLSAELGPRVTEDESACPIAVIDATGSPHLIRDALRRIADHGVLVLTAALPSGTGELDFYQDLHLRNLTVVGFDDVLA